MSSFGKLFACFSAVALCQINGCSETVLSCLAQSNISHISLISFQCKSHLFVCALLRRQQQHFFGGGNNLALGNEKEAEKAEGRRLADKTARQMTPGTVTTTTKQVLRQKKTAVHQS